MTTGRDPHGKGSWYFVSTHACVLCGSEETLRERRWDERPADPVLRFEYVETACGGHFL